MKLVKDDDRYVYRAEMEVREFYALMKCLRMAHILCAQELGEGSDNDCCLDKGDLAQIEEFIGVFEGAER